MTEKTLHWLKVDNRNRMEFQSWEPWLKKVARTRRAFAEFIHDLDPMINETASCGILSSAASAAGLLSMTEYLCLKKHRAHYGKKVNGRADLWVCDTVRQRSWAFEAKQVRCVPGSRIKTFENAMRQACDEASRMLDLEADAFFGLLIATLPPSADTASLSGLVGRLETFADATEFACRVGGSRHPAYLFFRTEQREKVR